ncbi:MAG: SWIM zinc finger family protein [Methanomicrobiales archaeon]|nr:SWIM zinc finger family protein [Methanomicrobiales archaeon]
MTYWGNYYPPAKPLQVKNGMQARSKKGAIGETWWSKRFIEALERTGIGSRIERGRSYARKGQVISITIDGTGVEAQVQGTQSKPYVITISYNHFSAGQWEQILEALSSQALFTAMLLGGEIPHEIESVFSGVNLSLFPASAKEIKTRCSCPDSANPCKHIAAVYYILAEKLDRDPFLIFSLRGQDRETVLEGLRKRRSVPAPEEETGPGTPELVPVRETGQIIAPALSECMSNFWVAGKTLETFPIYLHGKPELDAVVLKRLGPSLFKIGTKDLAELLVPVYPKAREHVQDQINRLEAGDTR